VKASPFLTVEDGSLLSLILSDRCWGAADCCPGQHVQLLRQSGFEVSCVGSAVGDSGDGAGTKAKGAWAGVKPGQSQHGRLVHVGPWQHLGLLLLPKGIEKFENVMFTACS